jgi:hypothetical protein
LSARPETAALARHVADVLSSLRACTKGPDFRTVQELLRQAEEEARHLMAAR